jgi:hypothetical protein
VEKKPSLASARCNTQQQQTMEDAVADDVVRAINNAKLATEPSGKVSVLEAEEGAVVDAAPAAAARWMSGAYLPHIR